MTGDRGERDRALIEKSAALLAADYPLDVIIERLSNTIASELDATVFIALPGEDGTMRLSYVTQRGQRQEAHEQLMPEGSRVATVFQAGRALLLRTADDWRDQAPYEISYGDLHQLPMLSALYVPVVYGGSVLAVLSVARPEPEQFDQDDLRLIESLARHLAVAIRNQRSLQMGSTPGRYPWITVVAIGVLTLLAIAAISIVTNQRYHEVLHQRLAQRRVHAVRTAATIAREFREDIHLAAVAVAVAGPVRGDRALASSLIARLLRSREDATVFGMGIFFEPNVFERGTFAVFAQAQTGKLLAFTRGYEYPSQTWYQNAMAARGAPLTYGPFKLGSAFYIATSRAFFSNGHPAGVVTVDKRSDAVTNSLRLLLRPGEGAYLTGSTGRAILRAGSPAVADPSVTVVPVGIAGWALHLVDSNAALDAQLHAIVLGGIGLGLALAMIGIFFIVTVHRVACEHRLAVGLKMQRAELQQEIATRIDAEERLRAAAYRDALTGLPNRTFFLDQLVDVTSQRQRGGVEYAVLFVNLDRFHVINDSMGHSAGDELLRAIAVRLHETVPPHALAARLGSDEFVLLLPSQGPVVREAVAIAEDLLDALRNPFVIRDREIYSTASIGIVKIDEGYADAEAVLRDADIALENAKRSGRSRYAIFDRAMRERVTDQVMLEGELRGAVERGEMLAYYQPIVRLSDDVLVGFEMLARWHREGRDVVSAAEFVEIAEQTGMMRTIDAELFAQACRDVVELSRIAPGITVSVNVSANDLTRAALLADIDSTMELYGTRADQLRVEITETAVMSDAERALRMLHDLRARGLQMIVDDFGAGYSSLSYLQRLPIAGVKIDRSFVSALPGDKQSVEIVRAIVALAKALEITTTAEGVERPEQAELLRALGVTHAQGFYYSPALPFEEAKSLFAVRVE